MKLHPTPAQSEAIPNPELDRPVTTKALTSEFAGAPDPHPAGEDVKARAAQVLRPPGALTRLDELAAWVASWQANPQPVIKEPSIIVFAGDHGVVSEGVSAFGSEVNTEMLKAFRLQRASISAIGRTVGAEVVVVDVGVGRPTGNLRVEPALTPERLDGAFRAGRTAVRDHVIVRKHAVQEGAALESQQASRRSVTSERDTVSHRAPVAEEAGAGRKDPADLFVFGEMGIGNTTSAAALCAALVLAPEERTPAAIESFVGLGSGIDPEVFHTKATVVVDAVRRVGDLDDPVELLAELGGSELAAICGAIFEARLRGVPVILDGFIATAPALVLHQIHPDLLAHAQAGHRSAESGHSRALDQLGLDPLLDLGMRLGEGSGAAAAIPLVAMACRLVTEVPTFDEWFSGEAQI